ncbi:MAG: hypothetical protein ACYTF4_12300, partial [Planctomycetota bacterium]
KGEQQPLPVKAFNVRDISHGDLLQGRDREQRLSGACQFPFATKFRLMPAGPFRHHAAHAWTDGAIHHTQIADCEASPLRPIPGMEVRRIVVVVVHDDDDAEEPADLWHRENLRAIVYRRGSAERSIELTHTPLTCEFAVNRPGADVAELTGLPK